jgi:hypothetical protein
MWTTVVASRAAATTPPNAFDTRLPTKYTTSTVAVPRAAEIARPITM